MTERWAQEQGLSPREGGFPLGSVLVMVTDHAWEEEAGELRSGPDLGHSGITN